MTKEIREEDDHI